MPRSLPYLAGYPDVLRDQVQHWVDTDQLAERLRAKYPRPHQIGNDRALRHYVAEWKSRHMKKARPLSQVVYDSKIHAVHNALGLHSSIARRQGSKIVRKNTIRISTTFKRAPEEMLSMIVVHELAHLKEREHGKAFYQLCEHMLPDYHQLEFDTRLYITQLDLGGDLYA